MYLRMKIFFIIGTLFCVASGQTENRAKVKSLVVTSDIKCRYARTMVSAEYFNDRNSPALADFSVILPNTAYISNFTMDIGGNITVGVVKEKEEAKKIFDDAVERGESAGHVNMKRRYTQKFDMVVNVEPNTKVVFNLTYEELLKRTQGKYTHKIFLSNGEIIDNVLVEVFISEPQEINVLKESIDQDLKVRSVDYIDNKHVYIRFNPSPAEQEELSKRGNNGIFTVKYDVERKDQNAVYTLDGYFVHFFSPDDAPIWPKNVVFMIDVSGSMDGENLRMVKDALRNILSSQYSENDIFTFGTFSNRVTWEHSKGVNEAMRFIDSLEADGATNLYDALQSSLEKLREGHQPGRTDVLFLLTDGYPTAGVESTTEIRMRIKESNADNVMIYTLGFGENCDHQFLQALSNENNGFSRKIYVDTDSAEQIQSLFQEISYLLLKDVIITYVNSSIDQTRLTMNEFKSFFKGSEIAIAGPINKGANKSQTITVEIKGVSAQAPFERKLKINVMDLDIVDAIPRDPNLTKLGHLPDITKKTWAYLTLRKMFEKEAPRKDIIAMAIKNNFVTPLTSIVVTKAKLEGKISEDKQTQSQANRRPTNPATRKPTAIRPLVFDKVIDNSGPSGSVFPTHSLALETMPPTTEATTTPLRDLRKHPAIIITPSECDLKLCVSRKSDCFNGTKVLLLKDSRAGVEIYGYPKEISDVTCVDNLYGMTLKSRHMNMDITPFFAVINGKKIDITTEPQMNYTFKRFFKLTVLFNRSEQPETISLQFLLKDDLKEDKGIYGKYTKKFDCHIRPSGELQLGQMSETFRMTNFQKMDGSGLDQCYI